MNVHAIVGGTGLSRIDGLVVERREMVRTPFGQPSGPLLHGRLFGAPVMFLARHGLSHSLPPHAINYRANVWALSQAGATGVIAVAAVGSVDKEVKPVSLVLPNQIIDYTCGRENTFFDGGSASEVVHVDFSEPYDAPLRSKLILAARRANVPLLDGGVYGVTQGPRCETGAEVQRMRRDGCTVAGMTGMPEAVLARELSLPYASICAVVSRAGAPLSEQSLPVENAVQQGVGEVRRLIASLLDPG